MNLRAFIDGWPYEPEELREDNGPVLVECTLPRRQVVCDMHTPEGVRAADMPASYPLESDGAVIGHDRCQLIGKRAKDQGYEVSGPGQRGPRTAPGASWLGSRLPFAASPGESRRWRSRCGSGDRTAASGAAIARWSVVFSNTR